ncbi:MAG: hypothetical protein V2I79_01565 [Xanthomonadales bacterium]|jgi:hypothetical protein|nr:hypothetical protein [Xanthomonadales bacterium]
MANHRIYLYTSLARPLDLSHTAARTVLYLLPLAVLLGSVVGWMRTHTLIGVLQQAAVFAFVLYAAWALAREMDPDDSPVAFISMAFGITAAVFIELPGLLIVLTTLGLVRVVNRSSGLQPRRSDAVILTLLSIAVIYSSESYLFGAVAALAFFFDGSLKQAERSQWLFGLVCLGGTIVYMVDHDIGFPFLHWPKTLFEWLALFFVTIFVLDMLLLKRVRSKGDVIHLPLDVARVRGGMTVGALAALQGIVVNRLDNVVVIVAVIAGLCIGIAVRKRFRSPVK